MERIIYYPETLLQTSAVPSRTFTETGFLAGLISDGQEPEHRSSRDHLLPCSTPTCPPRCLSESARRPRNELPNSTTSSKFYRENPRNHIVQTLAFPLNSFYRAAHSAAGWEAGPGQLRGGEVMPFLQHWMVEGPEENQNPGFCLHICIKVGEDCVQWSFFLEIWCSGIVSTFIKKKPGVALCPSQNAADGPTGVAGGCLSWPGHLWEIPDLG